jgi:Zn-dependent oligopeptidase
LETLSALKRKEHESLNLPVDNNFYIWDYRYYDRVFVEQTLDLDDMLVKEYFPVSVVVPAIMDIYQTLLGVRFEELKGSTWHPGGLFLLASQWPIIKYTLQMSKCLPSGRRMPKMLLVSLATVTLISSLEVWLFLVHGILCLLYFLEAKYSHAAVWGLIPGYELDSKYNHPLVAMVANLAKATPDKPALMRHDDVVTFFHEMGHVFHGLLSRTKYSRFHGTKCVFWWSS